jgi:hypothetical protein
MTLIAEVRIWKNAWIESSKGKSWKCTGNGTLPSLILYFDPFDSMAERLVM